MDGSQLLARMRTAAPPVKHGCSLEGGKMLNCVGISREDQQTWLGWLTISPSSDTTMRRLVSVVPLRG